MGKKLPAKDYHVAWISPLYVERLASMLMLDEIYESPDINQAFDKNQYVCGAISGHSVVIAGLPRSYTGQAYASKLTEPMFNSFPNITHTLLVGIGGGVPRKPSRNSSRNDVYLGDVVIGSRVNGKPAIVAHDYGRKHATHFEILGSVDEAGWADLQAVEILRLNHDLGKTNFAAHLKRLQSSENVDFSMPDPSQDLLFQSDHRHKGEYEDDCKSCCDPRRLVDRAPRFKRRREGKLVFHEARIATGGFVVQDAKERDDISKRCDDVLCIEMEAFGVSINGKCLVIRGISDYCDSHKNDQWQAWAAGNAAAFARELLCTIKPFSIAGTKYYIPLSINQHFVGRHKILDDLKGILFTDQCSEHVCIFGLGGIGKTQIALQMAYWVKENQPHHSVFWLPAINEESFEQACRAILEVFGITPTSDEDPKVLFKEYLNSGKAGAWLLIVDNADDYDLVVGSGDAEGNGLYSYLPRSNEGRTLFTTRYEDIARYVSPDVIIEVKEMDQNEAGAFVRKSLEAPDYTFQHDDFIIMELLEKLTLLPLAISQAIAYLKRNRISIAEYLELMKRTDQDMIQVLSRNFPDNTRYRGAQNAIATTWIISFDNMHIQDHLAAEILMFMSRIEPKRIPRSILPDADSEATANALGTLQSYAFIVRYDQMFDMHSLVHLSTGIWLKQRGLTQKTEERVICHLEDIFPSAEYENRWRWREYMTHAVRAVDLCDYANLKEKFDLCFYIAQCLLEDGRPPDALRYYQLCHNWREKTLKPDDSLRLISQHELAGAYLNNGQVKKAVSLLEEVVRIQQGSLSEDHPRRLASQHELAYAYLNNGQVKKAVSLLEEVVRIQQNSLSEDHPRRLASQHTLARAYLNNGQVKEAVSLLEEVARIQQNSLSEDHPRRLASQHTLASAYLNNGQVKEAVSLLEEVVRMDQDSLSEDHPRRLASQHQLAGTYLDNGQVKKAVSLLEEVVRIQQDSLSEDHPDRLASQHMLAYAYLDNGQVKKAVSLLEEVVRIQQDSLSEDHPDRLASQHELARAYHRMGKSEEAIAILRRVVNIDKTCLPKGHKSRVISEELLAEWEQTVSDSTSSTSDSESDSPESLPRHGRLHRFFSKTFKATRLSRRKRGPLEEEEGQD